MPSSLLVNMYAKVLNCAKAPSSLHSYARYRLEDYAPIISFDNNKEKSSSKSEYELLDQHLLAQALYNTCDTERAMERYKALLDSTSSSSDQEDRMELLTNGARLPLCLRMDRIVARASERDTYHLVDVESESGSP
jgi:vacuolar-type H+-ATPase catalytic subunit A/Vma1